MRVKMRVKKKARARIHMMIREIALVLLFLLLCCLYANDSNDVLCKPANSNIAVILCVTGSNFKQFKTTPGNSCCIFELCFKGDSSNLLPLPSEFWSNRSRRRCGHPAGFVPTSDRIC